MKTTILAALTFIVLTLGASAQVRSTGTSTPILRSDFKATDVSLVCTSEPRQKYNDDGLCPPIFTFTSAVTANGVGSVKVELLLDGVVKQTTSLSFSNAGTKSLNFTYDASAGGPWKPIYQGTFCVRVTNPNGSAIQACGFHVRSCIHPW
jgi:hypothetical protein